MDSFFSCLGDWIAIVRRSLINILCKRMCDDMKFAWKCSNTIFFEEQTRVWLEIILPSLGCWLDLNDRKWGVPSLPMPSYFLLWRTYYRACIRGKSRLWITNRLKWSSQQKAEKGGKEEEEKKGEREKEWMNAKFFLKIFYLTNLFQLQNI